MPETGVQLLVEKASGKNARKPVNDDPSARNAAAREAATIIVKIFNAIEKARRVSHHGAGLAADYDNKCAHLVI